MVAAVLTMVATVLTMASKEAAMVMNADVSATEVAAAVMASEVVSVMATGMAAMGLATAGVEAMDEAAACEPAARAGQLARMHRVASPQRQQPATSPRNGGPSGLAPLVCRLVSCS